ncbi:MAG: hypothetical protein HY820_25695 [Acidobacteria bacterium]|nr:hypothetical protein [Acidobacteriota bacterium]
MTVDERIERLTNALEIQGEQIAANSRQIAAQHEHIAANSRQIAAQHEHIVMLLEDSKTRNTDIEGLIEQSRLANEQARLAKVERDQDAQNIRALARIAEAHERRLSDIEGPPPTA